MLCPPHLTNLPAFTPYVGAVRELPVNDDTIIHLRRTMHRAWRLNIKTGNGGNFGQLPPPPTPLGGNSGKNPPLL